MSDDRPAPPRDDDPLEATLVCSSGILGRQNRTSKYWT
jgi:hypothetical protein